MNNNILDLTENEIAFIKFRYAHIDPDDLLSYAPGMQTLRNIDILETLVKYDTKNRDFSDNKDSRYTNKESFDLCLSIKRKIEKYNGVADGNNYSGRGITNPDQYVYSNLQDAYNYCTGNRKMIEKDKKCGCFACLTIFDTDEIKKWKLYESTDTETAICPLCGVDAIISESSGYPITIKFLVGMFKYWFADAGYNITESKYGIRLKKAENSDEYIRMQLLEEELINWEDSLEKELDTIPFGPKGSLDGGDTPRDKCRKKYALLRKEIVERYSDLIDRNREKKIRNHVKAIQIFDQAPEWYKKGIRFYKKERK